MLAMAQKEELTKQQELIYEMRIGLVMTKNPVSVAPEMQMSKLREILQTKRISGMPVLENGFLVGMVSLEDFIECLTSDAMNDSVAKHMSTDVITLFENDFLVTAVREFERTGFGRFPVLNRETGELVGILTKGDILRGVAKKLEVEFHRAEKKRYKNKMHILDHVQADETRFTFQYHIVGNDFNRAGEAAGNLKKNLKRLGLPPEIIRRVAIASYEAEMNLVIYTSGGYMTARISPEMITVNVFDNGPGIPDVDQAMQEGYSTAENRIRDLGFGAGMGLPNIKKCSDEMLLRSKIGKGTNLRFSVKLYGKNDDN